MIVFIRYLKINKIAPMFFTFLLVSKYSFSEQIIDQDVDITLGSTLSNVSGLTIHESSGGPFSIDNEGTIEASNIDSNTNPTIKLEVATTINNSGLIDASGSVNINSIHFTNNLENNSLTNSGTISSETTGSYGHAIHIENSNISKIKNTSNGTITVTNSSLNSAAIRVSGNSTVDTIENDGVISSNGSVYSRGIISINTSSIDQITNKGTITSMGGSESNHGIVFWNNSDTIITNSGDIEGLGGSGYGIRVGENGGFSSLTNTGTITGSLNAIANSGEITNIFNSGSINSQSSYDINNVDGNISNLFNAQDDLTYIGRLPSNYLIKVNSTNDYGKINISNPAGSMNVGIEDNSTITEGTYEDVVDGVTSSNIAINSGTYISDENHYKYSIENSVLNQWDLIVNDLTADVKCSLNSNDPDCQKTDCISTSIENGLNNLNNGNFALMNTFDCNKFGESGKCISIGIRNIQVNEPKSDIDGIVFVYGHKTSPNNRWGFFINSNISYNTNTNLSLSNKTPLLGLYGVWNENADQSGLQIKIGNSYQSTNANIIRPIVGVSDKAEGETSLEYINLMAEFRNNKKINKKITISPYFAAQYSQKHQNGFTETGVDLPITYNDITDTSLTAITGIKYNYEINSDNSIFGASGFEYDIFHNTSALTPTGVSGLTSIDLTKNYNPTRPIITFGLNHNFFSYQTIEAKFQYQELSFKDMSETNLYINYKYSF